MWFIHAYPGKPNVISKSAQKAMADMGQLVGRPYDEIVRYAGPPNSRQPAQDGLMGAFWLRGFLIRMERHTCIRPVWSVWGRIKRFCDLSRRQVRKLSPSSQLSGFRANASTGSDHSERLHNFLITPETLCRLS